MHLSDYKRHNNGFYIDGKKPQRVMPDVICIWEHLECVLKGFLLFFSE
jgi:hypothetical protein